MIFSLLAFLLSLLLYMILMMSMKIMKDKEKMYSFECGFNLFMSPKTPFSIQYFKILLLFVIFDMEIIVILPLILTILNKMFMFLFSVYIMIILIMGLLFEWKEGSLEWLK